MHPLLSKLETAHDLHDMTLDELDQLASEVRDVLCNLLTTRTAHFASNLGVVELCLALHSVFDFRRDRLIWDTGHQIYPHKLVTGRYRQFSSMRTKGGLMGYPNPNESDFDLFMTGHAGSSVSTMLGLKTGDDLQQDSGRRAVAVIGDGAFPSGIVFEAMNNLGGMKKNLLMVLNDNKMSICPRVGGIASYLDRLRTTPFYTGLKSEAVKVLNQVPLLGDPVERLLSQIKEGIKAGLHGGMLFEELGFRYIGPIDGHNIRLLRKYLRMVQDLPGPVLLHVVTEKGHGFEPAREDPVFFHTPPALQSLHKTQTDSDKPADKPFTHFASSAIHEVMSRDKRVTVITAAMCQGNKLEKVRDDFADRFFDTGICEAHGIAFAAGQAKTGLRPIAAIYSTFLQRAYDQIFQEVALQNLPVLFMLDRAGLTAPDGPTHHGLFDLGYLRVFPNMVVMAPGDALDLQPMVTFALQQETPCAIRYPKTAAPSVARRIAPVELGRSEVIRWGTDGVILCFGSQLQACIRAAEDLQQEGLEIGVVNARFVKPIDHDMVKRAFTECGFVVTVEEAALMGGFGSAVLESASNSGLNTIQLRRLGIPDRYIEHGDRSELLSDLGLDAEGIAGACRSMLERVNIS